MHRLNEVHPPRAGDQDSSERGVTNYLKAGSLSHYLSTLDSSRVSIPQQGYPLCGFRYYGSKIGLPAGFNTAIGYTLIIRHILSNKRTRCSMLIYRDT